MRWSPALALALIPTGSARGPTGTSGQLHADHRRGHDERPTVLGARVGTGPPVPCGLSGPRAGRLVHTGRRSILRLDTRWP